MVAIETHMRRHVFARIDELGLFPGGVKIRDTTANSLLADEGEAGRNRSIGIRRHTRDTCAMRVFDAAKKSQQPIGSEDLEARRTHWLCKQQIALIESWDLAVSTVAENHRFAGFTSPGRQEQEQRYQESHHSNHFNEYTAANSCGFSGIAS